MTRIVFNKVLTISTLLSLPWFAFADAEKNVSERVSGHQQSISWAAANLQKPIDCDASCRYAASSTAAIKRPTQKPSHAPAEWPVKFKTSQPLPPLLREHLPTPVVDPNDPDPEFYHSSDYQRSQVMRPQISTEVEAHTFSSGRSDTVSSLFIAIDGSRQSRREQFLEFRMPTPFFEGIAAYNLVSNNWGGTYVFKQHEQAQARYSFDVIVNGLIVWHREENFGYWESFAGNMFTGFEGEWGSETNPAEKVTLFLGSLPEDEIWRISLVYRTNVEALAPDCGRSSGWNAGLGIGESMVHCYELSQQAELHPLTKSGHIANVYSRDL